MLATWSRGSGQEPEAGPHTSPRSYVVDHFSPLGAQAVIDLWEDRVLDGEMRALLRVAGGNLFEDSLEIETEATIWTPTFLDDFEKSRGYDLRPWLPFVLELKEKYQFSLAATDPATADSLRTNEIRDDYNQVLSDLYLDCHLRPLQDFARGLGLGIRIQPYGLETDTMRALRGHRRAGDRVARVQEPRRLPDHGVGSRHGRSHGPVLRGDLLQRRGLQHDVGRQQRQPDGSRTRRSSPSTASSPPA